MASFARSLTALEVPIQLCGRVVHGFGRGSAKLGFPTANLGINWADEGAAATAEERAVRRFVDGHRTGIYAAWAQVADGADRGVYKVAMSVGWNPHFGDLERKTIEAWLLHDFDADFYDRTLKLVVVGFVREELKFGSLDELIREIRADGDFCAAALDAHAAWRTDPFFADDAADASSAPAGGSDS